MNANQENNEPADPSRVTVQTPQDLRYWADKYHVSPQVILDAVGKVGPMVGDVERELRAP